MAIRQSIHDALEGLGLTKQQKLRFLSDLFIEMMAKVYFRSTGLANNRDTRQWFTSVTPHMVFVLATTMEHIMWTWSRGRISQTRNNEDTWTPLKTDVAQRMYTQYEHTWRTENSKQRETKVLSIIITKRARKQLAQAEDPDAEMMAPRPQEGIRDDMTGLDFDDDDECT